MEEASKKPLKSKKGNGNSGKKKQKKKPGTKGKTMPLPSNT
jgi:hypothetical protein